MPFCNLSNKNGLFGVVTVVSLQLLQGSHETIDGSFIVESSSLAQKATAEAEAKELLGSSYVSTVTDGGKLYEEGITYAQMQVKPKKPWSSKMRFISNSQ